MARRGASRIRIGLAGRVRLADWSEALAILDGVAALARIEALGPNDDAGEALLIVRHACSIVFFNLPEVAVGTNAKAALRAECVGPNGFHPFVESARMADDTSFEVANWLRGGGSGDQLG